MLLVDYSDDYALLNLVSHEPLLLLLFPIDPFSFATFGNRLELMLFTFGYSRLHVHIDISTLKCQLLVALYECIARASELGSDKKLLQWHS